MNQTTSPSLRFPSNLHRRGVALLNQQCWLWGQDVKREQGNLLVEFGFTRLRPPEGQSGPSQYSLELGNGNRVRLWGFGMYFGRDHGVYLNRFKLAPRSAKWIDCWKASDMAGLVRLRDWSPVVSAFLWIADYEEWVLRNYGCNYRKQCLMTWHKPMTEPCKVAYSWRELVENWENILVRNQAQAQGLPPHEPNNALIAGKAKFN